MYKATIFIAGVNPTYYGNNVDEVLEKAAEDGWIEKHIDKGWVFTDPDRAWEDYAFSHFIVDKDYEIVMCVFNPVLIKSGKGE